MAIPWVTVAGKALVSAAKWLAPKIAIGAKTLSRTIAKTGAKVLNISTNAISKGVLKGGERLASTFTNKYVNASLLTASKILSHKPLIAKLLKDVAFKATKQAVKPIPYIGSPAYRVLDAMDVVIGIPFI